MGQKLDLDFGSVFDNKNQRLLGSEIDSGCALGVILVRLGWLTSGWSEVAEMRKVMVLWRCRIV